MLSWFPTRQKRNRRVITMQARTFQHMSLDQLMDRGERHTGMTDQIGESRQAQIDALARNALGLAVQRLMLASYLSKATIAIRLGPAHPRGMTWNGAGGWLIFSQQRQVNFSRTVWITFHWRGMTSSVSVISSPIFTMRSEPQQAQLVGASITTRSRGRWSGKDLRTGLRRVKARTVLVLSSCAALLRRQRIFSGCGFQFFELQFQLIDQPRTPLGGDAIFVAAQLGDLQLQFLDHRFRAGCQGARLNQIAFRGLRTGCLRGQFSTQSGDFGSGI